MYVAFAVLDLTNSVISETQTNEIYVLTVNVYNLNTGIRSLKLEKGVQLLHIAVWPRQQETD